MSTISVGTISDRNYIAWVQRSLNRLLGGMLITDGLKSQHYLDLLHEFNFTYGFGEGNRDIGVSEQDALIHANYKSVEYVEWIQRTLVKVGAGDLDDDGIVGPKTRTAVKTFQAYQGLLDDSWVGAKTETALIRASGDYPPGTLIYPGGPPTPPKPPVPPIGVDPLPIEKRMERMINAVLYGIDMNQWPNEAQRKEVGCFLKKLKMKLRSERIDNKPIDDYYIQKHKVLEYSRGYVVGKPYPMPWEPSVGENALEQLRNRTRRLSLSQRLDRETIKTTVIKLEYEVSIGLSTIQSEAGGVGGYNPGAQILAQWRRDSQKRPESIISCYPGDDWF